jgi:predicted transcriptional regulator
MRVNELMQRNVQTVADDEALNEAIGALTSSHISALAVVDRTGQMVGVLSSTDVLTSEAEAGNASAREELFENTVVGDIMTRHPLTVSPNTQVREAAQQMLYAEIHRLFVVEDQRVVGVISTTDIMRAVATGKI